MLGNTNLPRAKGSALGRHGKVIGRKEVVNTPKVPRPFFEGNRGATVAMETGLCRRWISARAKAGGCDVPVGMRAGSRQSGKAKTAVARKLAVTMLAMLKSGRAYGNSAPVSGAIGEDTPACAGI